METSDGDGTHFGDYVVAPSAALAGMFALQAHGLLWSDKATGLARRESIEMPEGTGYGEDGTMGETFTEADWAARGIATKAETRKERLEYLRTQIEGECISMGEIAELQSLIQYIDPSDVQLLEWAGVPEFGDGRDDQAKAYATSQTAVCEHLGCSNEHCSVAG